MSFFTFRLKNMLVSVEEEVLNTNQVIKYDDKIKF